MALNLLTISRRDFVPPAWVPDYPPFDTSLAELYPLFSDNTIRLSKRNYSSLPRNCRFTDQICARLILEGIPNTALKTHCRFDFVGDSSIRKGRPHTGPPAVDEFGRIYRFRGYAFCGEAVRLLFDKSTVFVDIERPGLKRCRVSDVKRIKTEADGISASAPAVDSQPFIESQHSSDDGNSLDSDEPMDTDNSSETPPRQPTPMVSKKSESQVLLEALCALYAINGKLRNTLNTTAATLNNIQNGDLQSAADSLDGPANQVDLGKLAGVIRKVIWTLEDVGGELEGAVRGNQRGLAVVGKRFQESAFKGTWESVQHPGRLLGRKTDG